MSMAATVAAASMFGVSAPAAAEETTAACAAPEFRAADFWVGDWLVEDRDTGRAVGRNRIERLWGGCALLERFSDDQGFSGGSLLQWDARRGVWRLTGGGSTGAVMVFEGKAEGAALSLTHATPSGQLIRMTLEPQGADVVIHASAASTDGGLTWRPRYAYVYRRAAPGAA